MSVDSALSGIVESVGSALSGVLESVGSTLSEGVKSVDSTLSEVLLLREKIIRKFAKKYLFCWIKKKIIPN